MPRSARFHKDPRRDSSVSLTEPWIPPRTLHLSETLSRSPGTEQTTSGINQTCLHHGTSHPLACFECRKRGHASASTWENAAVRSAKDRPGSVCRPVHGELVAHHAGKHLSHDAAWADGIHPDLVRCESKSHAPGITELNPFQPPRILLGSAPMWEMAHELQQIRVISERDLR